jgi:hypothetical protein
MESVTKGIKGMVYTPNDGRRMFNKKPLTGGDTVYGQEQDHSVEWLHLRDQTPPEPKPVAAMPAAIPMAAQPEPATKAEDFTLAVMKQFAEVDWSELSHVA